MILYNRYIILSRRRVSTCIKSYHDDIFILLGVTFDAGGISIKPSANMDAMRADMGGGACTLASLWGVAKLKLPVNVRAYIPLAENLPSGVCFLFMIQGDILIRVSEGFESKLFLSHYSKSLLTLSFN